jgi:hypothetical protein
LTSRTEGGVLRQLNVQPKGAREPEEFGGKGVALHRHVPAGDSEIDGRARDPRELAEPADLNGVLLQKRESLLNLTREFIGLGVAHYDVNPGLIVTSAVRLGVGKDGLTPPFHSADGEVATDQEGIHVKVHAGHA